MGACQWRPRRRPLPVVRCSEPAGLIWARRRAPSSACARRQMSWRRKLSRPARRHLATGAPPPSPNRAPKTPQRRPKLAPFGPPQTGAGPDARWARRATQEAPTWRRRRLARSLAAVWTEIALGGQMGRLAAIDFLCADFPFPNPKLKLPPPSPSCRPSSPTRPLPAA